MFIDIRSSLVGKVFVTKRTVSFSTLYCEVRQIITRSRPTGSLLQIQIDLDLSRSRLDLVYIQHSSQQDQQQQQN